MFFCISVMEEKVIWEMDFQIVDWNDIENGNLKTENNSTEEIENQATLKDGLLKSWLLDEEDLENIDPELLQELWGETITQMPKIDID